METKKERSSEEKGEMRKTILHLLLIVLVILACIYLGLGIFYSIAGILGILTVVR